MSSSKRPIAVTLFGYLYIAVGTMSFGYHFREIQARGGFQYDDVWVELVGLVAIVAGVFMLRGQNWARWLAVTWIAVHVVLSAFHKFGEFAMHCLFFAVIAWFLFRPEVARYFRGAKSEPI